MSRREVGVVGFAAAVLLGMAGLSVGACRRSAEPLVARRAESTLWETSWYIVRPEYPESSRRLGVSGLAVVELRVGVDGAVERVSVLEAPDKAISSAVASAAGKWRFTPAIDAPGTGRPMEVVGKLTFYYSFVEGIPTVQSARERRIFLESAPRVRR